MDDIVHSLSVHVQILGNLVLPERKEMGKLPTEFHQEHCREAVSLVQAMTASDHNDRPTAKEIFEGALQNYSRKITKRKLKKQQLQRRRSTTPSIDQ